MTTLVLTDAFVSINAVDLSDHVRSLTLNYENELLDDTVMGDDTRSRLSGLFDWNLEVVFLQDFAAAEIDATLHAIVLAKLPIVCVVRADNAAGVGAANPDYTGTAVIGPYPILSNAVGELAEVTARFEAAGTLVRTTV